ncbi:hypothetical protein LTR08_002792 [Meristemomyces frigidus]|nr:hypothetical protein LTR08_002792 [Meristemomyces frigidus]
MSLNGLSAPAVDEALQQAIVEAGGWFLLKYISRDSVELLGRGKGGVHEARIAISKYEEASPLYGLLIYRRRKVLIKYIPPGTSRLLQARTAVHFQDVLERYSPYETLLEIATADELNDTSLASSFPLHTASPSTSSNRLHEISEDGEDSGPTPRRPARQSFASTGSIFGTQRYKMETRVDQLMGPEWPRTSAPSIQVPNDSTSTLPLPLSAPQKTSVSQYLVRDDYGQRSVKSLGTQPSLGSMPDYAGPDGFERSAEHIPNSGEPPLESPTDYRENEPVGESAKPSFSRRTSAAPSYTAERSVEDASIPERPSIYETRTYEDEPYDFSKFEPKPKVKLGPRPIERSKRPTVASVSTVPATLRPIQKKPEPTRPASLGPLSVTAPTSSMFMRTSPMSNPASPDFVQPPPIPYTPEYSPRPLSGSSIKSAPSRKSTAMTPDKVRLLKAVELRKKQLQKLNPQQQLNPSQEEVPVTPEKVQSARAVELRKVQLRRSNPQQSFNPPKEEVPAMPQRAHTTRAVPQKPPEIEPEPAMDTQVFRAQQARKPDSGIEMGYEKFENRANDSQAGDRLEVMSSRFSNTSSNDDDVVHKEPKEGSPAAARCSVIVASLPFDQLYGHNTNASKGSWLSRVSHRASHIPNRPLNASAGGSRDTLPLRGLGGAGYLGGSGGTGSTEQLAVLQKTSSYPGSPISPASPTETEFAGATPIDASFGDRVDLPPEPLTARALLLSDRSSLPSQRSRSGIATQVPEPANKQSTMDRYAHHAGNESYDSDGEADDEFERSVVSAATTQPTHYDDQESDHPSESEDERESLDGGDDTPTTQGWGTGTDGRSPTGLITDWTEEQVADYIAALSPPLKQYGRAFVDDGIVGEALVALTHEHLRDLGVNSVGHRLTILKAVYDQKIRSGVKIEDGDYVPLSAEGEKGDLNATQDDIARVIESIRLRDQRIFAAEAELRTLKHDLDRISDENRKLREETLPIMRLIKDQRTPLPDPSGGTIPSPRDAEPPKQNENLAPVKESKGSSLSRKFSTKKLFLGSAPKQPSPTHPPQSHTPQPREVRDDPGGTHLEASAAAMAASSHLTASMTSMTSQPSPNSSVGQQLSPTSPAYSSHAPSSGGSYHQPGSGARSFPRDSGPSARHAYAQHQQDDTGTGNSTSSHWSNASTIVGDRDPPASARMPTDRPPRRQAPTPSPREDDVPQTAPLPRDRERDRDRDNTPGVEIFKSFRVSIEDPCRVVLPVALKRYNITDDWRQYALYIVYGDQERCLGLEEKPLLLFKQLDKEGRKPMFMLRRHASPQEGWSATAHHSTGAPLEKSIPGGVL